MTRPIYEPSPNRTDAVLGYGNDQLFRRPAPQGAESYCDRAYMRQIGGQTITTASTTNLINFDPDFSVYGVNIGINETTGQFLITASGIYLLSANVLWSGTFAAGKMTRIAIGSGTGSTPQDIAYTQNWVTEEDLGTNNDICSVEHLVFLTGAPTVNMPARVSVRQLSGVNKDISTVDFSIVRLCEYDLTPSS